MKPDLIDLALLEAATLYATALEALDNKERFEPDWTWVEVAIGCLLCLTAAGLRGRQQRGTWEEYEAGVLRAFMVGGLPIVVWQLWQAARRHYEATRGIINEEEGATWQSESGGPTESRG